MGLVNPHGRDKQLRPLLLAGEELQDERRKAQSLPRIPLTSREASDLIMLGIGAFTPLGGFMGPAEGKSVCDEYRTADGVFWPIPITLSVGTDRARGLGVGDGRTCPHGKDDRVAVSGTMLRNTLSEGGDVPEHFSRPEVLAILKEYYTTLEEKVEIKLHKYAKGDK